MSVYAVKFFSVDKDMCWISELNKTWRHNFDMSTVNTPYNTRYVKVTKKSIFHMCNFTSPLGEFDILRSQMEYHSIHHFTNGSTQIRL
jgi:hypothetical protein